MERSVMYEAMMEPYISLRDLAKQSMIPVARISDMRLDQCSDASSDEVRILGQILNADLSYMLNEMYRMKSAARKTEATRHFEAMFSARKTIIATGKRQGAITCPVCKALLHFQVHTNGHVWAKCETSNCLMWME